MPADTPARQGPPTLCGGCTTRLPLAGPACPLVADVPAYREDPLRLSNAKKIKAHSRLPIRSKATQDAGQIRQARIQVTKLHRDHVRLTQGLEARGDTLCPLSKGLPISHRPRSNRYLLVMKSDPKSRCLFLGNESALVFPVTFSTHHRLRIPGRWVFKRGRKNRKGQSPNRLEKSDLNPASCSNIPGGSKMFRLYGSRLRVPHLR